MSDDGDPDDRDDATPLPDSDPDPDDAPRAGDLFDELDEAVVEDPFADLGEPEADVDPGGPAFTEVDVGELDEDAVWEELDAGDAEGAAAVAEPQGARARDERSRLAAGERGVIVPKRSYCERCEHFSAPPEVGCTHSGTEIRELVDANHFRVVNCPVVERRRNLAEGDTDAKTQDAEYAESSPGEE